MWIHTTCGGPAAYGTSEDFGIPTPKRKRPSDGYWCGNRCKGSSTTFNSGHPSHDPRNWRSDELATDPE
ncbi:hypothetical protein SEA_SUERTE_33 [Gordonia phage Suerte]|uniref:Uncharacterized protein n=1 Tax=Gordonia phage Suerte TaxID=2652883 RepID=A0A5P8DDH4_9CAUD|nr:hypothetical protein PP511_gp33 [Gordonia phage Suerte]QFP97048.1 hypothetical protein SEA_SUERTE_33 [Gordonia phage Suerte]